MLKACWDCIAGSGVLRDREQNEDAYGTQLNGETQRAPPWPEPRSDNEIMFLFPRKLSPGDQIIVSGSMRANRRTITASLITGDSFPDYQNVACQFVASFPTGSNNQDDMLLKLIQNGYHEIVTGDYQTIPATDFFTDLTFKFIFKLRVNGSYGGGQILDIYIDESFLEQVTLKHDLGSIRYLELSGDIQKVDSLEFRYV